VINSSHLNMFIGWRSSDCSSSLHSLHTNLVCIGYVAMFVYLHSKVLYNLPFKLTSIKIKKVYSSPNP
jgi:hypothetical protein